MGFPETEVNLTEERPSSNTKLMLFRPGTLTGRVVDDEGNPVAKLDVIALYQSIGTFSATAITDNDGKFTFTGLPATLHVIRISPASARSVVIMETFVEKDLKEIDQDYETSYWPGDIKEFEQALPIQIASGASVSAGTFRVRKVPHYRAHLKFSGECAANERWLLRFPRVSSIAITPRFSSTQCRSEFLIRLLPPGSETLMISSGEDSSQKTALITLSIRDENIETTFTFSPDENITVRLIDRDGGELPRVNFQMSLNDPLGYGAMVGLEKDAVVRKVIRSRLQIRFFFPPPPNPAIHEIRYDGQPVVDGWIDVVADAMLEIVLDQQPATLSFTGAPAGHTLLLAKWPLAEPLAAIQTRPPWTDSRVVSSAGNGQFTMAEGEYRLIAMSPTVVSQVKNPQTLLEMLAKGEKITLRRGEQKSIEIKR